MFFFRLQLVLLRFLTLLSGLNRESSVQWAASQKITYYHSAFGVAYSVEGCDFCSCGFTMVFSHSWISCIHLTARKIVSCFHAGNRYLLTEWRLFVRDSTFFAVEPVHIFSTEKLIFLRTTIQSSTFPLVPSVVYSKSKRHSPSLELDGTLPYAFALFAFVIPFVKNKVESKTESTTVERKTSSVKDSSSSGRIITPEELAKHKSVDDGGIWSITLETCPKDTSFHNLLVYHPLLEYGSDEANKTGPYANEPERHPALYTFSKEPRNAGTPSTLIPDQSITPNELFFVRNHFPVPVIDYDAHRLHIVIPSSSAPSSTPVDISLCVDELKANYPKHSIVSTIICAGCRRSGMAAEDSEHAVAEGRKPFIRGLSWNHSATSTALWTGVRLVDLLARHWLPEHQRTDHAALLTVARDAGFYHVQFEGSDTDVEGDTYGASLPIEWALDPQMDVLIAYEMNGQPLPRDHGYPLRAVVPGCIGARQVKWLKTITLSKEESPSFYQREDYKIVYPTKDGHAPSPNTVPAIYDLPVQSAICEPLDDQVLPNEGSITVRGYAFSGGGRGILSVRVTTDDGKTWHEASLRPISPPAGIDPSHLPSDDLALTHRTRQQWAWTLWEVEIPVDDDAEFVELACCARDSSNAVQPQTCNGSVNVRGLLTNSWHRVRIRLKPSEPS
ncbi:unnamed protein product [Dicrocoelium dendriticum]|nr:unnamed protein product [Dicrocoelium dendriticum]